MTIDNLPETKVTDFNSSVATLIRIDNTLRLCALYNFNEDVLSYYKVLRTLRKEVFVKLKKDEKEKDIIEFNEIKKNYINFINKPKDKIIHSVLLNQLDHYELKIRQYMNERQMLLSDSKSGIGRFRNL